MSPTRQDLEQLSQQLPPLVFSPEVDSFAAESPLAQAYLDYYQINFAQEFPGLEFPLTALWEDLGNEEP